MKHLGLALACLVALTSTACGMGKSRPVYDECLLTVTLDQFGGVFDAVADCMRPDGSFYECRGECLDGKYLYSAEHRKNIIEWTKSKCSKPRSGD